MTTFLMPREHGAYAQLVFPLVSGLIIGRPTLAAVGLVVATVSVFLAYEATAVLLGVRGVRLQREQGAAARRQLKVLGVIAVSAGGAALATAPSATRLLVLVPAGLCALLIPLVPVRRVKTLAGETIVAGALAAMHLPIAAAGGAAGLRLWAPAAVWFAVFFLATLAVHAIKARQKQRDLWLGAAAAASTTAALIVAAGMIVFVPPLRMIGLALALPLGAVLAVNVAGVRPHALRRVGWTLVAADTVTLALLLLL